MNVLFDYTWEHIPEISGKKVCTRLFITTFFLVGAGSKSKRLETA